MDYNLLTSYFLKTIHELQKNYEMEIKELFINDEKTILLYEFYENDEFEFGILTTWINDDEGDIDYIIKMKNIDKNENVIIEE